MKSKKFKSVVAAALAMLLLSPIAASTVHAADKTPGQAAIDSALQAQENARKDSEKGSDKDSGKDSGKDSDKDKDEDKDSDSDSDSGSSDYSKLNIPARLTTAYHDGYQLVLDSSNSSDSDNKDATETFKKNIQTILQTTGFSNVGALIGPISLSQAASGTDTVAQRASADSTFLKSYMTDTTHGSGSNSPGMAYYAFGEAFGDTAKTAANVSPANSNMNKTAALLQQVSGKIASAGISILKYLSPAPLILSIYQNGILTDKKYADNLFVQMIIKVDAVREAVNFFSTPITMGGVSVSLSSIITLVIAGFMLGLAGLAQIFASASTAPLATWAKKTGVKIALIFAGVPLGMKFYDFTLNLLDDFATTQNESAESKTIKENLGLAMWARANFALPAGTSLEAKDGKFVWTEDNVQAINLHSAEVLGYISQGDEANPSEKVKEAVVDKMNSFDSGKNTATIKWKEPLTLDNPPKLYATDNLNNLASTLGANEEVKTDDKDINLSTIGYLNNGGMTYSSKGNDFTYSEPANTRWGFSPLAAYNFINTDFESGSISAKDNMDVATIPAIAAQAPSYNVVSTKALNAQSKASLSPFVVSILSIIMIWYSIKGMITVMSKGVGGMLFGTSRTALGSPAGFGELIGSIFTLIGGMILMAIINVAILQVLDTIYGFIVGLINGIPLIAKMNNLASGLKNSFFIKILGGIGTAIVGIAKSIGSILGNTLMLFFGGAIIKLPIMSTAHWLSGIPDNMAESAVRMAAKITGDYSMPGGRSMMNGNAGKMIAKNMIGQAGAIAAGASMISKGLADAKSPADGGDGKSPASDAKSSADGGKGTSVDKSSKTTNNSTSKNGTNTSSSSKEAAGENKKQVDGVSSDKQTGQTEKSNSKETDKDSQAQRSDGEDTRESMAESGANPAASSGDGDSQMIDRSSAEDSMAEVDKDSVENPSSMSESPSSNNPSEAGNSMANSSSQADGMEAGGSGDSDNVDNSQTVDESSANDSMAEGDNTSVDDSKSTNDSSNLDNPSEAGESMADSSALADGASAAMANPAEGGMSMNDGESQGAGALDETPDSDFAVNSETAFDASNQSSEQNQSIQDGNMSENVSANNTSVDDKQAAGQGASMADGKQAAGQAISEANKLADAITGSQKAGASIGAEANAGTNAGADAGKAASSGRTKVQKTGFNKDNRREIAAGMAQIAGGLTGTQDATAKFAGNASQKFNQYQGASDQARDLDHAQWQQNMMNQQRKAQEAASNMNANGSAMPAMPNMSNPPTDDTSKSVQDVINDATHLADKINDSQK